MNAVDPRLPKRVSGGGGGGGVSDQSSSESLACYVLDSLSKGPAVDEGISQVQLVPLVSVSVILYDGCQTSLHELSLFHYPNNMRQQKHGLITHRHNISIWMVPFKNTARRIGLTLYGVGVKGIIAKTGS